MDTCLANKNETIFLSKWRYVYNNIYSVSLIHVYYKTVQRNSRCTLHRGSYMSAHVLFNLVKELGKSDKMRGLPNILLLFRNEFNKLNNTGARMLVSIYHMP